MQTNPAAEQCKIIRWSESPWNQSGKKGKGLWSKGFANNDQRRCNAAEVWRRLMSCLNYI